MKENLEIMMGTRQAGVRAVTTDAINIEPQDNQQMKQVTAEGLGVVISGQTVVLYSDYVKLINDVQTLANDVAYLQQVVNLLIQQIRTA
jgi:hypothetical protein